MFVCLLFNGALFRLSVSRTVEIKRIKHAKPTNLKNKTSLIEYIMNGKNAVKLEKIVQTLACL